MSFSIARSVEDAVAALTHGARPIAGGSDLVVGARHGGAELPAQLVAIDRIPELARIDRDASGVMIGAAVTHATLMQDPTIVGAHTALADAAALVGSPATRNVGTLGGNIMNGSPAMDSGAPLVVLDASVSLRSHQGERRLPIADLWTGPGTTVAAADELCTHVHLPSAKPRSGSAYVRLEYRRAMEIAIVGAAAAVELADDDSIVSLRVALSAVAPTVVEVSGLEVGGAATYARMRERVASASSEQASPIADLRAGSTYRRHMVGVMAARAFDAATRRAHSESIPVPVNRAIGVGAVQ